MSDLWRKGAVELAALIRDHQVSSREVVQAPGPAANLLGTPAAVVPAGMADRPGGRLRSLSPT